MALLAVVDEAGFERGLDAGDDGLVDVAFALLAPGLLDVDIEQFLPIDDGHAQFFRLRGVEQHAFHVKAPDRIKRPIQSGCQGTPMR